MAKNFLLGNEVSLRRKVREAILAFRIEQAYSKDHILELYLNEIYLGYGSYGVAAAALNYFDKSLDELTIAEAAFLAALPKAPNNYNPIAPCRRRPSAARLGDRSHGRGRPHLDGRGRGGEGGAAGGAPSREAETVTADYFAEEVRRELIARFGEDALYKGGLSVRSTVDPQLQAIADHSLRAGLVAYDRRHGWRGPTTHVELGADWQAALKAVPPPLGLYDWNLAVVLDSDAKEAQIGLASGEQGASRSPK